MLCRWDGSGVEPESARNEMRWWGDNAWWDENFDYTHGSHSKPIMSGHHCLIEKIQFK